MKTFSVQLRNQKGTTEVIKNELVEVLGASVKDLNFEEKQKLRLKYGAKIIELKEGTLKNAGIKNGFIIQRINKIPVLSALDVKTIMDDLEGDVLIEGYYPNGISVYYTFTK